MAPRLVASPCTAGSQACEQEAGQQRARRTARLPGSWCSSKPLYVKKAVTHLGGALHSTSWKQATVSGTLPEGTGSCHPKGEGTVL